MSCDDVPLLEAHPWYTEPAVWFWIALAVSLLALELWAWRTKRTSPSQWTQRHAKAWAWFRAVGVSLWALLGYHLFFLKVWYEQLGRRDES